MFDVTDYTTSITTMILFIVFTSIVLILLFAILIATVCNTIQQDRVLTAYQKDRFIYHSHTTTFDILLLSKWNLMQYCCVLLFFSTVGLLLCMTFEVKRQAMISFYGNLIVLLGIGVLLFFMIVSSIGFLCHVSFYDTRNQKQHKFLKFLSILFYPITYFLQSILVGNMQDNTSQEISPPTKYLLLSLERNIIETLKEENIQQKYKMKKDHNVILNELSSLDDRLDLLSMEFKALKGNENEKDVPTDEDYISEDSGNYRRTSIGVEV